MNKQQLAAKIWESANQMRSKIEANEYKDYILGFIFYKYLSDKLVRFAKSEGFTDAELCALSEDDTESVEHIKSNIGYFIAHQHLFSTWIEQQGDFDVAHVRDALSAFGRLIHPNHKRLFDGIFKTLETGLSKLGDTAARQTKAISELLQLIKDIPMDGRQGYDVLGFIYEYLISMFAANAGKKAGEFYTPHEVSVLMSEIIAYHLKDRPNIQIYDSTSGSGSLLLNIGQAIAKHMADQNNIRYYAQELKENTYNLTRMNLVMRGILPSNIVTRNADTLEDDWPYFDDQDPVNTYNPLYLDAVVSNPPYSQKWDPQHKDSDARYARFGLAPKSKADYAFLLHDLYHLKPGGIMAIVLPHGVLFRGGEEGAIRKALIENDHLETVIGLPPNIFFGTGIPTIILVLRQKRERSDVLIVDASKGFAKEGKNNKLRASDIKKITDTVIGRLTVPRYSRLVPKTELQANDYNLNIPRYVDSSEPAESWDLYACMFGGIPSSELDDLADFWNAFPSLRASLFADNGTPYAAPKVPDLAQTTRAHPEVQHYSQTFAAAFADFTPWMRHALLAHMLTLQIPRQEALLSAALFARIAPLPLIDRYHAYQILDDHWQPIATDLEILQTEGFDAARVVDPNFVTKKKDGKDVEVQEGWRGRILPFELVQVVHHKRELDALRGNETRLSEITASLEETLESLSDEDKANDTLNDAGDKFVSAAVAKEAKLLLVEAKKSGSFDAESYEAKIIQAADWLAEEKTLKAAIKTDAAALHLKTKATIEGLSDAQVHALLEAKWITPLVDELHCLPGQQIDGLTRKLDALVQKYQITYADNARDIRQTESALAGMIEDLDANAFDAKGLAELRTLLTGAEMAQQSGGNVPQIRFQGFEGEWADKPIGEVLAEKKRPIVLKDRQRYELITVKRRNEGVVSRGHLFGRDILVKNYSQLQAGDFVISKRQVVHGATGIIPKKLNGAIVSNEYLVAVNSSSLLTEFLTILASLPDMRRKFFLSSYGVDIEKLFFDAEDWKKRNVTIPGINEQTQIGEYFRELDSLIVLHQRKHEKLVTLKKAMLQKMFPQPGTTTPEIRFKGFEGDWKTCRLEEVATLERGKFSARPRNDPKYFVGGNIPFVQTGDVVSANRLLRRYSQTLNEGGLAVSRSFPANTILITIAANIGDLAITDFSVACPDSVVAINSREDFDTNFLYDFLGTKKDYLEAAATTAAQANINLKILKPLIIVAPALDEQTQIGKYFRTLDALIAKHATQLQKLQQIKSACLEKMFV